MTLLATESGTYTTELSNGDIIVKQITAPADISLPTWNLVVEDWNEGDKKYIYEDRGLGYKTTEVYFETKKTNINVGPTALIPWKDIPAVGPSVSGIGYYSTTFVLPSDWAGNNGAYLQVDSLGSNDGNLAAVRVNGQKAKGIDIVSGRVDISELLRLGTNEIHVLEGRGQRRALRKMRVVHSHPQGAHSRRERKEAVLNIVRNKSND